MCYTPVPRVPKGVRLLPSNDRSARHTSISLPDNFAITRHDNDSGGDVDVFTAPLGLPYAAGERQPPDLARPTCSRNGFSICCPRINDVDRRRADGWLGVLQALDASPDAGRWCTVRASSSRDNRRPVSTLVPEIATRPLFGVRVIQPGD